MFQTDSSGARPNASDSLQQDQRCLSLHIKYIARAQARFDVPLSSSRAIQAHRPSLVCLADANNICYQAGPPGGPPDHPFDPARSICRPTRNRQ